MQKPMVVGRPGYSGAPALAAARASRSGSSGTGLFSQKRGKLTISALFAHGVMVAICGSLAAPAAMRCNRQEVTMVSEFKISTSAGAVAASASMAGSKGCRVGKACVVTGRLRGTTDNKKTKHKK